MVENSSNLTRRGELIWAAEDAALAFARGPTSAYEAIKMLTAEAETAEDFARHLTRERDSVVRLADHPQVRAAILSIVNR